MAAGEVTIGEFARRSGLSLKALRLYDARGLLQPVRVDPATGYRYYDLDQLARARTVSLLRRLEMPLAAIADVLAEPVGQAAAIRSWWSERQRDLADRGPELDLVLQSLGAAGETVHTGRFGIDDVLVRPAAARTVATVRRHVVQDDLVAAFASDVLEIRSFLDEGGASYGTEFWVVFHGAVGRDGDGPIETCVPYEGALTPVGPITLRQEPAQTMAFVPVTAADCRYPQIIGAYVALETWFSVGGRRAAGPSRELYPVPWSDEGVVAHVAQPVA
ncbi:MerR family transcriptional regulator [Cellulomonas fengjieae]|uniref:MerR family transcriptional regulator n=1 Tax=Cellulomonas fengjieae TaxID=2819978 RepID=UPI001AB00A01|nr:MerR family transcriptional regulator [Cellulomonas fengjieae]MBO3100506.1 MerR family transcriptional regulator [Cellulomonas fengjieae]